MVPVYFDECTSINITHALNNLEVPRRRITVYHTTEVDGLGPQAPDENIVKKVSSTNGVLFSQDDDFKKSHIILEAMKEHPIGLFYFKQPKSTSYWDLVRVYTKCWLLARIEILKLNAPFYFEITPKGAIRKGNL